MIVVDGEILSLFLLDDEVNKDIVVVEQLLYLAGQCTKLHFCNPNESGLIRL